MSNMAPNGPILELLGVSGRQVWVVLEGIVFLLRMCLMVFRPELFFFTRLGQSSFCFAPIGTHRAQA